MTTHKVGEPAKKQAGNRGMGRKRGTLNKSTKAFKEAVEAAAEALGGDARLAEWAQESPENERAFWTVVYPKLAPLQVNHKGSVQVHIGGRVADL